MKNSRFLLLAGVLLSACAKKTYLSNRHTLSHQVKTITDSSARRSSSTIDNTITFTKRSIDTNIFIAGKALSGYLLHSNKDTSANFENEDLTLFLHTDRTGRTTATAIPKLKTIKVQAFEHTAVYNNVIKKEDTDINIKTKADVKVNLNDNQIQKEMKSSATWNVSLIVAILLICVFIWIAWKFLFLRQLFK